MKYQDLALTKARTQKMYIQNPNRSISTTYRNLRNKSYNSLIGDYPLLYTILEAIKGLGIQVSRFQLNYALNQSSELVQFSKSEKTELLNQLLKHQYVQMKTINNSLEAMEIKKLNSLSL